MVPLFVCVAQNAYSLTYHRVPLVSVDATFQQILKTYCWSPSVLNAMGKSLGSVFWCQTLLYILHYHKGCGTFWGTKCFWNWNHFVEPFEELNGSILNSKCKAPGMYLCLIVKNDTININKALSCVPLETCTIHPHLI